MQHLDSGQTHDACAVPITILQREIQTILKNFTFTAKLNSVSENFCFENFLKPLKTSENFCSKRGNFHPQDLSARNLGLRGHSLHRFRTNSVADPGFFWGGGGGGGG